MRLLNYFSVMDIVKYGVPTPLPIITTRTPTEDDKQAGLIRVRNCLLFRHLESFDKQKSKVIPNNI